MQPLPVALYGFILLMAGLAYYLLARVLVRQHGPESSLAKALGRDFKGMISMAAYLLAIALAFVHVALALALYLLVAGMWLRPDQRIERQLPTEA